MLVTAVLLAQYAGTLDISETSRLAARSTQPLPTVPAPPREIAIAADASLAPVVRLKLSDRRWDWTFAYTPTLAVTDIELPSYSQPVGMNVGSASVAWHDRRVRLMLSESASYGWEDLGYVYGAPIASQPVVTGPSQTTTGTGTSGQPPGQTSSQAVGQSGTNPGASTLRVFPFGSSSTNASMLVRASREVTVSLSGGYTLSGNLTNNPQATLVYPEQYGPLGSASVSYASSAVNSFVTAATAQETTTPMGACLPPTPGKFCREDVPILLVQETARHRVSGTSTLSANVGVSASIYELNNGTEWGILPVGGVSYSDRFGAPTKDIHSLLEPSGVRLSADVAPTINVFTGAPSNRLQVTATWVDRISRDVGLSLTAGVLQTVPFPFPDPSPLTLLSGAVELKVQMTRLLTASMGIQGFWETQQNVGALPSAASTNVPSTSSTEVGYVALTARVPTLRL